MSGMYGRDLPAAVKTEIGKMVLGISRGQLTQERAMQDLAYYCLERDGYFEQPEAAPSHTERLEADIITLCLRLCLEPADSHSPETREVLERYRAQWKWCVTSGEK